MDFYRDRMGTYFEIPITLIDFDFKINDFQILPEILIDYYDLSVSLTEFVLK